MQVKNSSINSKIIKASFVISLLALILNLFIKYKGDKMESTRKKTDAQIKAQKNWDAKNRDHSNYLKYKSSAKTFINKKASKEDL